MRKESPFLDFEWNKAAYPSSSLPSMVSWCSALTTCNGSLSNHTAKCWGEGKWQEMYLVSLCQHNQALHCISRNKFSQITFRNAQVKLCAGLNSAWSHWFQRDCREFVFLTMFCQIKLWRIISIAWMKIYKLLPSGDRILCLIDRKILSVNYINV